MTNYAVAVIGTGVQPGGTDDSGFAMGYNHADAYAANDSCELVACSDLVRENAERFAEHYGFSSERAFEDHREMLRTVDPDVVSVTTPIQTHSDIVVDCARSGVDAVHCEKPMASTWGGARLMAQECTRRDVQLSFNHQLRFSGPVQDVRRLLDDGEIGEVRRVEASRGDLYEAGIHQLDLCSHFTGDVPAEWVLGAVDYRNEQARNGVHIEDQALGVWKYENGVHGFVSTGDGASAIGASNRIIGTEGTIEVTQGGDPPARIKRAGGRWEPIESDRGNMIEAAIANVVDCIGSDEQPLVGASRVMVATELALGLYESVRRRGRVDLPLTVEDNPLEAMLATGDLNPS